MDNTPPVAVCDEHTVVTLNESGLGSYLLRMTIDNCSLIQLLIRRMNADSCGVPSDINSKPQLHSAVKM